MQLGIDDFGERIVPFRGGRSNCQICNGSLIAKCGDIYRWHWQHVRDRNCDSWKEHETKWHREWKEKFPKDWREIIIEEYGEKHIADVKTSEGTVIEFQNSPISVSTISIRENFYGKMIWVLNADGFHDKLTIWSVVTQKLRKLEADFKDSARSFGRASDSTIDNYTRRLATLQTKIDSRNEYSKVALDEIEGIEKYMDRLEDVIELILSSLEKAQTYNHYPYYWMPALINNLKQAYKGRKAALQKLKLDLETKNNLLKKISTLEEFYFERVRHVIVSYGEINASNYHRAIAILKEHRYTMFPQAFRFKSEYEFLSFEFKSHLYDYVIDPAETITKLKETISNLDIDIDQQVKETPDYRHHLRNSLISRLAEELEKKELSYLSYQEELMNLETERAVLSEDRDRYEKEYDEMIFDLQQDIQQSYGEEKLKVMKQFKGQYGFRWKNERKSWADVSCPLYFDVGETYLFERTGETSLKKISIEKFLMHRLRSNEAK